MTQVIVIADPADAERIRQRVPTDVAVFAGDDKDGESDDALGRLAAAAHRFSAEALVRVSATTPFVDPTLIDRLVATACMHRECDYISYRMGDGRPAVRTRIGMLAEFCRGEALQRAAQHAVDLADREDATRFICQHPESFQLRFIPVPEKLDRDDVRLVIDSEEDLENAHLIYEALGPEGLDWQRIASLLDHQPAMRARMASLNRTAAHV